MPAPDPPQIQQRVIKLRMIVPEPMISFAIHLMLSFQVFFIKGAASFAKNKRAYHF